ncbi:MAG TPA: M24 family metallopeptidase [Chloroflexota bacterium]|nr:M24 family metallopeptidase [Chloroflexota bacterium]
MGRGTERVARIRSALQDVGLDALVCSLPTNVLLLSGYWPVVGTAVAVATRDGRVAVLAPEDEEELARQGWATEVRTYHPGSLSSLTSPVTAMRDPLAALLRTLGLTGGRIGYEDTDVYEQSSYAAMYLLQAALPALLRESARQATTLSAAEPISRLRSTLTTDEVAQVRDACAVAAAAFTLGMSALRPGATEAAVAAAFGAPLSVNGLAQPGANRAGGFAYCMSGPNAALAGGAYARSRNRDLRLGDFVLVHCNSYLNGYWTDVTRTYCLGVPDERQRAMYGAVLAARAAALTAIRPGVAAAAVDKAAREVLTERGYGNEFTHGVGHNVGLSAISAEYPPRLHPASSDRLEVGMTFNIEPAIYIRGYGGLRHCDVVTVREKGADVLTPFQAGLDDMTVRG